MPVLPNIPSAHALDQSGPTSWSPYGPQVDNLLITVYSDFQTMFNAFTAGQVDITDWPVGAVDLPILCDPGNVDFFCTSPEGEFGIFQLDINHHKSFAGISQLAPRTVPPAGILAITTAPSALCSAASGTDRIIVNLENAEAGNVSVKDPLNTVTIRHATAGSPSATVAGSAANNVYTFPCILAGPYNIQTSAYSGIGTILQQLPGLDVTVTFRVNFNSVSNSKPSAAGPRIGRALAHLLDKPNFLNVEALGGLADHDDIQSPPSQGLKPCTDSGQCAAVPSKLPQTVLNEDLSDHTWTNAAGITNEISAYNLQSDVIGGGQVWWGADGALAGANRGYPGANDLRAACDHLVAAGFTLAPLGATCVDLANIGSGSIAPACSSPTAYTCPRLVSPAGANQQIVTYIRTHAPRKAFGQVIADGLNLLFGTPNHQTNNVVTTCFVNYGFLSPGQGCTPRYYAITQIFDLIFGTVPPGGIDDWNLYTGGFSLGSTPDHLWALYNSQFTGAVCGGLSEDFPNNYGFYCNPSYDSDTNAGEFSTSLSAANGFFGRAVITAHRDVMTIPVFSQSLRFVALNGWNSQPATQSSLVGVLGHGFQTGFWSLLNMRQKPGFVPAHPIYAPGGGSPNLIRRGFSQDVHKVSPFHALTVWDFEVLSQVYDSMLAVNPLTGGTGQQVIDWMTISHTSSFNPSEASCVGTSCVTGTTTQKWFLRNDLKWHDGLPVTADDIVYSIIAYRDVPSANLQPAVATVSSATTCGTNCLQVKLQLRSPFYELNIGTLPILPKHLWQPVCGNPPSSSSLCADPSFDPLQRGIFVGSGPWVCRNLSTGSAGGSCSQNADGSLGTQDVTLGGRILLRANSDYMRGPANLQGSGLQKISWADKNDDGLVNIQDIADAAFHFGVFDPYWDHPIFGASGGVVDIGDIATLAFYFDHGITKPFSPSQLLGLDPQLDPYRKDLSSQAGPVVYYEGGLRTGSNQLVLKLVALSGAADPTTFTATLTTDSGTLVGTVSGVPGGASAVVLFPFSNVAPGRYQLRIFFLNGSQPIVNISINA